MYCFLCNIFRRERSLIGERVFQKVLNVIESYSSIYHPISCLKRDCISYVNSLAGWRTLPKPSDEDFSFSDGADPSHQTSCKLIIANILIRNVQETFRNDQLTPPKEHGLGYTEAVCRTILEIISESKLSTLFRPRHELESVALLRNVVKQCLQASNQVGEQVLLSNQLSFCN